MTRELVAAEAWYHVSCYKLYTNSKDLVDDDDDSDTKYKITEAASYDYLFQYIRQELFQYPKVVKLTDLTNVQATHMHSQGVTVIKDSTKKHTRRKLEAEFRDALHMCSHDKGKVLVFPDSLTMNDLAKENQQLKKELQSLRNQSSEVTVLLQKAALHLRSSRKFQENRTQWPFIPSLLHESTAKVPADVRQFMFALLCGDMKPKKPSQRIMMLVDSFCQDLVYSVSSGSQIPPKHIILPCVIKA